MGGCALVLPETAHRPVIRNPFPQLSRVAIAPFFNHSDEATVDGRDFALGYFAELQSTPGFEVVPLGVVEEAIIRHRINLSQPAEARRLAGILGVDTVVVGSVTDFAPYYPPRCGLRVEWYTANIGYHEIPAGYGLPWNTPDEEFIPDSLVYESQMALGANADGRAVAGLPVDGATIAGAAHWRRLDDRNEYSPFDFGCRTGAPWRPGAYCDERGQASSTASAARCIRRYASANRYIRFGRHKFFSRLLPAWGLFDRRLRTTVHVCRTGRRLHSVLRASFVAYADISGKRSRCDGGFARIRSLSGRRAVWRLGGLLATERRLHPLLLSPPHLRNAVCSRRQQKNKRGVALA